MSKDSNGSLSVTSDNGKAQKADKYAAVFNTTAMGLPAANGLVGARA